MTSTELKMPSLTESLPTMKISIEGIILTAMFIAGVIIIALLGGDIG